MSDVLPCIFQTYASKSKIGEDSPQDVECHESNREVREKRTLCLEVPKGPKDFATFDGHVDLFEMKCTVK